MKQILSAAVAMAALAAVADSVILWPAGDFAGAKGTRIEKSEQGDVLVLPKPGAGLQRTIRLERDWRVIRLKGEMKVTNVPQGDESWQTGRFTMRWTDDAGKTVSPWPYNIGHVGTTDWLPSDRRYVIPRGATRLEMGLCNLSKGGEVRFRNFSLEMVRRFMDKPCNAPLPDGAPSDPESLECAWTATSSLRTRYSMNGLWRLRPAYADDAADRAPADDDGWDWGRLPFHWHGRGRFAVTDDLSPYLEDHPERVEKILPLRAWYARTFALPASAAGKRALLAFDLVASRVVVYVDGQRAGAVDYPNGEVDLTPFVKPGTRQTVALDVTAFAEGETLDYNEATRADKRKRVVKIKGLTGDVWLDLLPKGARIADAWTETSVEKGEIRFVAETEKADASACRLRAEVTPLAGGAARTFEGTAEKDGEGRLVLVAPWKDAKLWDVDTPQNRYACRLSLLTQDGAALDTTVPFEFGFREVKIVGRDLLLNGKPIHLRALHDGTLADLTSASAKTNAIVRCRNIMAHGFNFMIAGNYSFGAGATPYVEGMLSACDETGMLYSFTMPHFKDFTPLDDPAQQKRYRAVAHGLMRLARRHPAVILWAANHNAAGYLGAGNPRRIDGLYELPPSANGVNRRHARISRKIIRELDPTRPCYHHESGNLDDWHCFNCYLDWAPVQERSDWSEHWATVGVKPLFYVEWGLPHVSSFSSYRGPLFIWRGRGYMSLWASEYAAALRGDAAYEATPEAFHALDREETLWAKGQPFHWSNLSGLCSTLTNNYQGIQGLYADDNWRSFRGWGVTAVLPWDQGAFFTRVRQMPSVPATDLYAKTPGWKSPIVRQWADPDCFALTAVGAAISRWNRDDCAWIGGGDVFTTKRHHYRPGEEVKKQLVIVNDRRHDQTVRWTLTLGAEKRTGSVRVTAGGRSFVPVTLPAPARPGVAMLSATFGFDGGSELKDALELEILSPAVTPKDLLSVYDPKGLTIANLKRLGFAVEEVKDIFAFDISRKKAGRRLVVGREALTREILERVLVPFAQQDGHSFVFEQSQPTLESVGFRVQTYGLRHAFPRFDKPTLHGTLSAARLRDWAGESTLVEPFDPLREVETGAGKPANWAGFAGQTRVWRCGNRGTVASVIPEKPSFGDWCALVDGGFDLQYAPLLEWRLRNGSVTFCQMDVTGRTVNDPAADDLVRTLVAAAKDPVPPTRSARPLGLQAYGVGRQPRHAWMLEHDETKVADQRYLVTEGAGKPPADFFASITNGATALLCGLSAQEVRDWCPVPVRVEDVKGRHFTRLETLPPELNGLSNADWAWHGKMDFAAFTGGAGEGNEAIRVFRIGKGRLVFWQVPPWTIDTVARPYLRTSKRHAEAMLSRLLGNLGFNRGPDTIRYADQPERTDDPYRYYHW